MHTLAKVNFIAKCTTPFFDQEELKRTIAILNVSKGVSEVRSPKLKRKKGVVSGYFDNPDTLLTAATCLSGKADGVYITLNPVKPELLARASNRLKMYADLTTSDSDILHRLWFPIDFDPKRPSGISSTDTEHEFAIRRAKECREWLTQQGWLHSILADSGNGAHLLYRIDLPNTIENTNLIKNCLQAVAFKFSDNVVDVDLTTFNAARIWKLYGTLACKGDHIPNRPHRLAKILEVSEGL